MEDEAVPKGLPVSEEDKFWLTRMREMEAESIKSYEGAAKQLVGMITVMQGTYAAVIAFSGIKVLPKGNILASLFCILPLLFWLISLFYAVRVFVSQSYEYYENSPALFQETLKSIADFKYKNLKKSYLFICVSFIIAISGIAYWLYCGMTG